MEFPIWQGVPVMVLGERLRRFPNDPDAMWDPQVHWTDEEVEVCVLFEVEGPVEEDSPPWRVVPMAEVWVPLWELQGEFQYTDARGRKVERKLPFCDC